MTSTTETKKKFTTKKKIIAVALPMAVIAGACGIARHVFISKSTAFIENLPFISKVDTVTTDINKFGVFANYHVEDSDHYKWYIISRITMAKDSFLPMITTRAYALDDKTSDRYPALISAKDKSINAIATTVTHDNSFSSLLTGKVDTDIRIKPTLISSAQGTINIPETSIIVNSNSNQYKQGSSFVNINVLGDVNIKTVGQNVLFKSFKSQIFTNKANEQHYKASIDDVQIGNMSIGKNNAVDVSIQNKDNNKFNLTVDATAKSLTAVKNLNANIKLNNLTMGNITALASAVSHPMAMNVVTKTANLKALFDYAKSGGNASVKLTGVDSANIPLLATSDLSFDTESRKNINHQNVFSILDSVIFNAHIKTPVNLATQFLSPHWLGQLLHDQMILLKGNQFETTINFKNMDAQVNDRTINL